MSSLKSYGDELAIVCLVLAVVGLNYFHRELPALARELGRSCRDLAFLLFGTAKESRTG